MESVAEPTGEAWLVQLQQAARADVAPADVSMMAQVATLKGRRSSSGRRSISPKCQRQEPEAGIRRKIS